MELVSISLGNTKLGNLPNISLPPVKACINCKHCAKTCYARKAYKLYPETKTAWDKNFALAKTDQSAYFAEIRKFLGKKRRKSMPFFRWHVSGDILDVHYLEHMCQIAEQFPTTKFLAFTKNFAAVNLFHADGDNRIPENLTIIFSGWPGMEIPNPYGHRVAWMQDGTETRVPVDALSCPGGCDTCGMCWSLPQLGRDVVFEQH